ncbi:MAG: YigZ family protein [Phycisphaerales bacterium]
MTSLRRPAGPFTHEIDRVKGSRFIADVGPAASEADAAAFLATIREREPSATHHCHAWRITPDRVRANDDGEPGGTAGAPILRQLESADLINAVVVVTRYYGGTNLGTGGLIRAYGAAARAGVLAAPVVETVLRTVVSVKHAYPDSAGLATVLAAHDAVVETSDYGVDVQLSVSVPQDDAAAFRDAVIDATAGRARVVIEADAMEKPA